MLKYLLYITILCVASLHIVSLQPALAMQVKPLGTHIDTAAHSNAPTTSNNAKVVDKNAHYTAYIQQQLDSLQYQYEVQRNGMFKCVFRLADERTQLLFIDSEVYTYQDMPLRELRSIAYITDSLQVDKMALLLSDNARKKMGAWQVEQLEDKYYYYFTVKIAPKLSLKDLSAIIELVVSAADDMELQLSHEDAF